MKMTNWGAELTFRECVLSKSSAANQKLYLLNNFRRFAVPVGMGTPANDSLKNVECIRAKVRTQFVLIANESVEIEHETANHVRIDIGSNRKTAPRVARTTRPTSMKGAHVVVTPARMIHSSLHHVGRKYRINVN